MGDYGISISGTASVLLKMYPVGLTEVVLLQRLHMAFVAGLGCKLAQSAFLKHLQLIKITL